MRNTGSDNRVLGDFQEEMRRRRAAAIRRRRITLLQVVPALALVWFGLRPLDLALWYQLAFLIGLLWLLVIAEGPAYQLADEMDLLEQEIATVLQDRSEA